MNLTNRRWLLPILVVALIGIVPIIWYSFSYETTGIVEHSFCPKMIPNYLLWLSMVLIIIAVVPISYYFISKRLEEKMEKNLNAIMRLVDHKVKSSAKDDDIRLNGNILRLLNFNEKKVVEELIENKGSILQSEISRMDNMTKLKTHRAVKELKRKRIVKVESYGKTNKIILSEDIKNMLLK